MAEPFKTRSAFNPRSAIMTESTEKKTVAELATSLSEEMLASIGTDSRA